MAGHHLINHSKHTAGFTIVELLIVIVVIGILAAITIVSFNGVSSKARASAVISDLDNVAKKLKIDQATNSAFPATIAQADGGKGIPASSGTTYQYTVDNNANPQTFCVTAVNGSIAYFVTESASPKSGTCPGDSPGGAPVAPTIGGYYDFSSSTTMTGLALPTIPDGSWMMIALAYTSNNVATPPAGWTTLYNKITAGTLQTMVFGKIKTSSEPSTFSFSGSFAPAQTEGVLFWGSGASSNISNWVLGSSANRNGTAAQQYSTTTPTVTTGTSQSLVLSISTERTSATETDISSSTGATRWFYIPQLDTSNKLQTIFVSYAIVASPGASAPVTVTYPNAQTVNATSLQIALPPA